MLVVPPNFPYEKTYGSGAFNASLRHRLLLFPRCSSKGGKLFFLSWKALTLAFLSVNRCKIIVVLCLCFSFYNKKNTSIPIQGTNVFVVPPNFPYEKTYGFGAFNASLRYRLLLFPRYSSKGGKLLFLS